MPQLVFADIAGYAYQPCLFVCFIFKFRCFSHVLYQRILKGIFCILNIMQVRKGQPKQGVAILFQCVFGSHSCRAFANCKLCGSGFTFKQRDGSQQHRIKQPDYPHAHWHWYGLCVQNNSFLSMMRKRNLHHAAYNTNQSVVLLHFKQYFIRFCSATPPSTNHK